MSSAPHLRRLIEGAWDRTDPDEAACASLYRPAAAVPGGLTRRHLLQGAMAGGGLLATRQLWRPLAAFGAEGTPAKRLVVIQLDGGNDGLSVLQPLSDPVFYAARSDVALAASSLVPLDGTWGLNPAMPRLAQRYRAGHVALVHGVGIPDGNLSHFDQTARWMSGDLGHGTGWVGRYLDQVAGAAADDPLCGVALGDGVPLSMVGSRAAGVALPLWGYLYGSEREDRTVMREQVAAATLPADAAGWTGALGRAVTLAPKIEALSQAGEGTVRTFGFAANLLAAGWGTRVVWLDDGGYDTHEGQRGDDGQDGCLAGIDAGLDAFWRILPPAIAAETIVVVFSEFGRRFEQSASAGTDHGGGGLMLIEGGPVKGGITAPDRYLRRIDDDGNTRVAFDRRAIFAEIVDHLGGDANAAVGTGFARLGLLVAPVVPPPPPPPPVVDGPKGALAGSPVGFAPHPKGGGSWLCDATGHVLAVGAANHVGDAGALRLNRPVVGIASTPSGLGYWLVASDGGVFAFGDAAFYGSTGAIKLAKPIVSMAATPTGKGYWMVATDGGVFAFGDATFHGSTGALSLTRPVVGMAPTPSGKGYWLVASDGGIFAFGDALFQGSTGALSLVSPVIGMLATKTGRGYWLAAADGGVFAFGDATFLGSTGALRPSPRIVGIAGRPGGGYTLYDTGGRTYDFAG
jgi:uncharacterized protein (DUF1501 family)